MFLTYFVIHGIFIKKEVVMPSGVYKRTDYHRKKLSEAKIGKCFRENNNSWKGGRIKANGYIKILQPNHPFCDDRGYVMEHRLVMEKHLGRFLHPKEQVHHLNGIRDDNRIENLKLLSGRGEHMKIHRPNIKNPPRKRIIGKCNQCNKKIEILPCQIRMFKKHFCNKECRFKFYRGKNHYRYKGTKL